MTFEEALRAELMTIEGLHNKVFPLNAPENTSAPYVIYLSSAGQYDKDLQGFHTSKAVSVELNIIHSKYSSLKTLLKHVIDKIKSFERRRIAETGPFIQEVVFKSDGAELYEPQVDMYRMVLDLKFYFKEEE